jgi:nucleoid-associated protein YejK
MTKEIKRIGSNIDLKGIVIHQVQKEAGTRNAVLKKASSTLNIADKEKVFIGNLNKAYYKKSNPIYGIFGNDDLTFQNLLKSYLVKKDFFAFSIDALNHYKKILELVPPATGGFVIFAHFFNTDVNNDYLLVLTINNKDGYVVSESDLTIKDIKNLDLNKVDVACMINLTKWNNIILGLDNDSKTYLSFVKGNKDVSYYFMSFIDCDNKTTSSISTQKLIDALEAYSVAKNYDRETKIRKRNEIFIYCEECINQKKEIQLSTISSMLDAEHPKDFQLYASDETFSVSSIISGDKSKLKTMRFVMYKDKTLTVEFDCNLLGKNVIYNPQKNELTIKNLPSALINQIPN